MEGSGGLGAVSIGFSELILILVGVVVVLFVAWKIAKLIWASFAG